ncbi:PREDICTED: uncharacterized protein LOC107189249 [Dufourea novaeangliae]|uniref:S-phase entry cyclin-5 n=1 Tax=Dufourea novaeangliae TaxID=178035 RepID=A0A154PGV6_DUFNO|nr:PREDICTED: uncharacterized protein LOC107189249 [Dufourea novaeangliae]KZC11091.1 S-phase entry cyclin-5 [Dufourea novaeangliae]
MSIVRRKLASAKAPASSKNLPLPSGKENERIFVRTTASATGEKPNKTVPRKRAALFTGDDRKRPLGEANARACESIAKKTLFHVHCDENNDPPRHGAASQEESRPRLQRRLCCGSSLDPVNSENLVVPSKTSRIEIGRKQPILDVPGTHRLLNKRALNDDIQKDGRHLASKIPRRVRSTSCTVDKSKFRSSSTTDVRIVSQQKPQNTRVSFKPVPTVARANCLLRSGTPLPQARTKFSDANIRRNRDARDNVNKHDSIQLGSPVDRETQSRANSTRLTLNNAVLPDLTESPVVPLKSIVPRPECVTANTYLVNKEPAVRSSNKVHAFPSELLCHAEYHNEMPGVEREREERAPRLSANFLRVYMNTEQRKLVVMFLISMGTHCCYPSCIIYQAVKLFDAAMDKIRAETKYIQLTALASLWIALKRQETLNKIPTATKMIALAKDLYAGREDLLIDYESKILRALNFNVVFPDAYSLYRYHLINYYRVDVPEKTFAFLCHAGGYVIDITLLDKQFCHMSPALIAVTAAELVLGLVLDDIPRWLFWRGLLYAAGNSSNDRFQDEEIDRCRVRMLRSILKSGKKYNGFDAVYKKYSRSRYGRISEQFFKRATELSQIETFDP